MTETRDEIARKISTLGKFAPGLLFCMVLAAAAMFVSQSHGGPAILYALLLGMPFNFLVEDQRLKDGIALAARDVLRLGVALLGARITFEQIAEVGLPMMLSVAIAVVATIGFGWLLAGQLGLPRRFGLLSAGSTAICGAAAAAAISSVMPRYPNLERDTAFTIIGVTTLSTLVMVLYPAITRWLDLGDFETGLFLGATIHDVAQVVGAGYSVSVESGDVATIVKLFRVALLLPLVFVIALIGRRVAGEAGRAPGVLIPWFLTAFAALVIVNSIGLVSKPVGVMLGEISRWCIAISIAALGVKTALRSFAEIGKPAIVLMICETVFIATIFLALMALLR